MKLYYVFIIIPMIVLFSCECKKNDPPMVDPSEVNRDLNIPPPVVHGFNNAWVAYLNAPYNEKTVTVFESGMKYKVGFYKTGIITVNLTKDSLEVLALKRETFRDSLQIEVFKKYLKK